MKIRIPKPVMVDITKLKKNPSNVKIHTDDQIHDIAELMKMIGFKDPIVIDRKNMIWAGHGRLLAAELLKMKEVPCIYADQLDNEQKQIFLLMDNKVNESRWLAENVKMLLDKIDSKELEAFKMNFDDYFDPNALLPEEEWVGMPEFVNDSQEAYQRILVRFDSEKDVRKFAKAINQNLTKKTRAIWYPPKERNDTSEKYLAED